MKLDVTYPHPQKQRLLRRRLIDWAKWPFAFAAYLCPILNLVIGGPAWSPIVMWSLWMVWSVLLSPAIVEYNRISQSIKLITDVCILLILIGLLLTTGWTAEVVPTVCYTGIAAVGVLFFTDLQRQKQNMAPMLMLCGGSLLGAVVGLIAWREESRWALAVMGAFSFALLAACFHVLGRDLLRAFKKHFHTES